jgi:hypothetical protein
MSTAAVSSSSLYDQVQSYFQARDKDLKQLGQDIANGDTTDAQQEFQSIQNLAQNGPFANGNAFAVSQRQQDFDAIGQALQSGNLSGAQQAFADLKSTVTQTASQNPSPVILNPTVTNPLTQAPGSSQSGSGSGSTPEIVLNLGTASPGEQITINLSNTSNGNEQLGISVTQPNQSPEQVTLNLNPSSNQQIILNLLGPSDSSTTTTSTGSTSGGINVTA